MPKEEILAAKKKEINGLFSKKVFSIVHKKDVEQDAQIMSYVWALKVRDDDVVKARLCVGGLNWVSKFEFCSPVTRPEISNVSPK